MSRASQTLRGSPLCEGLARSHTFPYGLRTATPPGLRETRIAEIDTCAVLDRRTGEAVQSSDTDVLVREWCDDNTNGAAGVGKCRMCVEMDGAVYD